MTKKGIESASADVGLILCVFIFRRFFNLVDKNSFKTWLKALYVILHTFSKSFYVKISHSTF